MNYKVIDIDQHTPISVFERLYRPKTSCLLESSSSHSRIGRYSIIATQPDFIFRSWGNLIQIDNYPPVIGDPLRQLSKYFRKRRVSVIPDVPLSSGGAIGYIGYDAARMWLNIGNKAQKDINIPDIYLLFYSKLVVFDHVLGKIYVIGDNVILDSPYCPVEQTNSEVCHVNPNLSKEAFEDMVLQAKEYIAAGDIYQANLSQRFEAETEQTGWSLYKKLRLINPSPFVAYLDLDGLDLISCSPERLFKLEGKNLQARPIAGTYPRGRNSTEDHNLAHSLIMHPKERAEHIMLVDLERNDLGRVCKYGTINVDELMSVESYSHVHHIVSNIQGRVKSSVGPVDIIQSLFPGGTITGCPKIRCMQIIDELEPVRRSIYTGSIGYMEYNGNMDFNIVIRTILKMKNKLFFQAGAGIVADSVPGREYYETLHKAAALIEAITKQGDVCSRPDAPSHRGSGRG